ncbi:MAG: hypothetical protein U0841_25205 [Chloroflexia bacterium]
MADGAPAILVVDDDPGFRELVAEVLSDEGYRPLAAAPADALAYAASQAARPGPARRPHARHRRPLALPPPARTGPTRAVPVIFVTGLPRERLILRLAGCEPWWFLPKPCTIDDLLGACAATSPPQATRPTPSAPRATRRYSPELALRRRSRPGLRRSGRVNARRSRAKSTAIHSAHVAASITGAVAVFASISSDSACAAASIRSIWLGATGKLNPPAAASYTTRPGASPELCRSRPSIAALLRRRQAWQPTVAPR